MKAIPHRHNRRGQLRIPWLPTRRFLLVGLFAAAMGTPATGVQGAEGGGRSADPAGVREILDTTGVRGGLIVHLGCGDGKLTATLAAAGSCLVHGLDTDADKVRQARAHLEGLGLYGRVSVERFDGKRLPYAENMVNLLLAEDLGGITTAEALAVLAPGGVLYAREEGRWRPITKPRPKDIDEWTHYLHDATGNPVAHDQVVGPPARLQWHTGPSHMRSHEHIPGLYALVSSGGRIFYIVDEAPIGSIRDTPRWRLMARDAFNGLLLWEQPVADWFPHIVNWGQTPRQLQRKLVAVGDRVYVTLGLHASLSLMDALTGETLRVFENARGTEEVLWHEGILLLVVRSVTPERVAELTAWKQLVAQDNSPTYARETAEPLVKRLRATEAEGDKAILALEADSGELLWKKEGAVVSGLRTESLCASGDRVFYQNGRDVVCLDLKTGRERWSASAAPLRVVSRDSVFCADGQGTTALSVETGEARWTQAATLTEIRDVFVAGGSLWVGGFKPIQGKRGPVWGPYFVTQRDLATGQKLRHIEPENPGHHHRCYANKATDRYILGGRRGTEFIDLTSGEVLWHSWARGVCRYGVMPCNGLLYAPPHACGCYVAAKLIGFNALAPARSAAEDRRPDIKQQRLERGPAYARVSDAPAADRDTLDWPTYRGDAQRSGATRSPVPAALHVRWQAAIGDPLTTPTVGSGKVFVAATDRHRVVALDVDTGKPAWTFTAGARVDSPPTLHQGHAILGCRDGYVYSLRLADGALAWRLRAARKDRRIAADGQLESVSPVHGSVLVQHGTAYITAGRSSYLDGGMDLHRVDPRTGQILSTTPIYSPDPETGRQPPHSAPAFMPGARSDILTADGTQVYLRDLVFDREGAPQPEGNPHLLTLTGFLDDTWAHRSYWIFGQQCSLATGCSGREKNLIYGRLLAFDASTIYGYGRRTVHWSNQLQDGAYRLFAIHRQEGTTQWTKSLPIQVRAMLLAGEVLFVAGPPAGAGQPPDHPDSNQRAVLLAISAADGAELARCPLDATPVFDGLAAARGRLFASLENGSVVCLEEKKARAL